MEKVYCKNCKYCIDINYSYRNISDKKDFRCFHPINLKREIIENWYETYKKQYDITRPEVINIHNDCKHYEKKE